CSCLQVQAARRRANAKSTIRCRAVPSQRLRPPRQMKRMKRMTERRRASLGSAICAATRRSATGALEASRHTRCFASCMLPNRMHMLILEALEHERGGVLVYQAALNCAQNSDLRAEWTNYLDETKEHVEALIAVCDELQLD